MKKMGLLITAFILLIVISPPQALADIQDFITAMDAENKGDHAKAANLLKKYLEETSPDESGNQIPTAELALGSMYRDGEGVRKNIKEALRMFEDAANSSDNAASNNALFALGQMYQNGSDINGINLVKAADYYGRCAERGVTSCKKEIALIKAHPDVSVTFNRAYEAETKGDYVKAAKLYKQFLAEASPKEAGAMMAAAEYSLGEIYRDGRGVGKNTKEAIRLFEKTVNSSDHSMRSSGLFGLGRIYQEGSEINGIDLIKAANYFNRCAKLNDKAFDQTCENLVKMDSKFPEVYVALHPEKFQLAKNESQPATLDSAINLVNNGKFREALPTILWWAKNGNGDAQYILSDFYKNAAPDVKDDDLSKGWLLKSAESGNKTAQHDLGLLYYQSIAFNHDDVPLAEAEGWLKKAAAQGDIDSLNVLGVIQLHPLHEGGKADPEAAFHYFLEAANAGSLPALLNLGDLYYDGIWGVPSDKEKAKKLYMQAADAGLTDAYLRLYKKYNIDYKKKSTSTTDIMNYLRSLWPDDKEKTNIEKIKIQDNATSKMADTTSPKMPDTTLPKTVDTTAPKVEDTAPPKVDIAAPKVASVAMSPGEIYLADSKSVIKLYAFKNEKLDRLGSAVAITTSKAITNCHVVNNMGVIAALINDKPQKFEMTSSDVGHDICIITTSEKSENLHPIPETRSYSDLKIGEKVYAIGSPKGLENTLSDGIISGFRDDNGKKLIQVTAPFTHGSSGGALIDENGKLIGITSEIFEGEGNIGFAIPVDVALNILLSEN